MRLNKLLVYLGLVALLCSLSWAADVGDDDEDDVEVDSENEPEDKARKKGVSLLRFSKMSTLNYIHFISFDRLKKKRKQSRLRLTHRQLLLQSTRTRFSLQSLLQSVANSKAGNLLKIL